MQSTFLNSLLILTLCTVLVNTNNATSITLQERVETVIFANQEELYTFTIPSDIPEGEELYINAEPVIPDPLQMPYLIVKSEQFTQACFNAHSQFSSYCKIPSLYLKKDRKFSFTVHCSIKCHLFISLHTSNLLNLQIGKQIFLTGYEQAGSVSIILVPISQKQEYNSLTVYAIIDNLEEVWSQAKQGLKMYVNYGEKNVSNPSEQNCMIGSQQLFSGGRIAIITREQAPPSSFLKIGLKISQGITVRLSIMKNSGQLSHLPLGKSFFGMAKPKNPQTYLIDTHSIKAQIQNQTIQLVFNVFSGSPSVLIGFDSQFNARIEVNRKHPSVSIELTSATRKQYKFQNLIYIKIQSFQASQYEIYTRIVNDEISLMKPYTAYFDQLSTKEVYNYFLDERYTIDKVFDKPSFIYNYTFKVQVSKGKGRFYIARCLSNQTTSSPYFNNLQQCKYNEPNLLTNSEFGKSSIKVTTVTAGSLITINMAYDITNCSLLERRDERGKGGRQFRQCMFQIIAVGESAEPWVYTIYAQRKYHINFLREGLITKQYLSKDTYTYFAFALLDYNTTTQVTFFSTTFSGQSILLVSLDDPFPSLEQKGKNLFIDTGSKSSITIQRSQLKEEMYIAVFAKHFTEVNLGVVVNRITTQQFTLHEGNLFAYTLKKGESEVRFKIEVTEPSNVIVNLNEVVGLVEMSILDKKGASIACEDKRTRQTCRFMTQQKSLGFTIVITGSKDNEQQFMIGFVRSGRCKTGILNLPLFVTLNDLESECYLFNLNRPASLDYMSSLTSSQLVQKDIMTTYFFWDNSSNQINPSQYQFNIKQLIKQCPISVQSSFPSFVETCQLSLNFVSLSSGEKNFYFSLDEDDQEIALYDGVVKTISRVQILLKDQKQLYYKVTRTKAIKIIASTSNLISDFSIATVLVSKSTFASRKNNSSVYPTASREQKDKRPNIRTMLLGLTSTAILTISQSDIKSIRQNDDYCYLLITVMADPSALQKDNSASSQSTSSIQIEVVQTQTTLDLGQTKTGYVTLGNYETYLVNSQNALVILRSMNSAGSKRSTCASVMGAIANGTITMEENLVGQGHLQLSKQDKIQHVFVKGILPQCSYQISYVSTKDFLYNAKLSQLYQLDLKKGEVHKFLYFHFNLISFKIVKLIGAGNLTAYIYPIKNQTLALKQILEMDPVKYPIVDIGDTQFIVKHSNPYFCYDCYYLVVFTSPSSFKGEVIFLRYNDPIPLQANYAMKEWLLPHSPFEEEHYNYYSLTDFNLTIQIISGKVMVVFKDPKGQNIQNVTITDKMTFRVNVNASQTAAAEYYSSQTLYAITATALAESVFYLKVHKGIESERIFEGLPATFQIKVKNNLVLQFINGETSDTPLTLMIEAKGTLKRSPFILNFSAKGEDQKGTPINATNIILQNIKASQTYMLNLLNFRGTYYIQLSSLGQITVTVLLLRTSLTHLSPLKEHLFDQEGIYQMFTNSSNVLVQVFNCQGDFFLQASKDYLDTQTLDNDKPSPIILRKPNYGGHYVLGIEGIFGSYYMRVRSKQNISKIQYLISYSYYSDINPYELIDAKNYDLNYSESEEGLQIMLNEPELIEGAQSRIHIYAITYFAYISTSKTDLIRFSKCGIRGEVVEKTFINASAIKVDKTLLKQLKTKTKIPQILYATIQASVSYTHVNVSSQEDAYPKHISLFYNVVQIVAQSKSHDFAYFFTDNILIFVGWMFLPFAIAAVIVFYLLRFCIRRLLSKQGSLVEEVEIVAASSPTIPSNSKLAEGIQYPDSAMTKIKEQL